MAKAVPLWMVGTPAKSVKRPPASSTITLHGREVPRLEVGLRVDLGLALGHERVAEVVAEAALAVGRVHQPHEAVPVVRLAQELQPRVEQRGLAQLVDRRDAHALAVGESRPATAPGGQRVSPSRDCG